jgi:hypothetical protein
MFDIRKTTFLETLLASDAPAAAPGNQAQGDRE